MTEYAMLKAGETYYFECCDRHIKVAHNSLVTVISGPTGGNYRIQFHDGSTAIVSRHSLVLLYY